MGEREEHPPAGALAPSPPSDEGGGTAQAVTEGETQENSRTPCPFVGRDALIAPPSMVVLSYVDGGVWAPRPTTPQATFPRPCRGRRLRRPVSAGCRQAPAPTKVAKRPRSYCRGGYYPPAGTVAPHPHKNLKNIPLLPISRQQGGLLRLFVKGYLREKR